MKEIFDEKIRNFSRVVVIEMHSMIALTGLNLSCLKKYVFFGSVDTGNPCNNICKFVYNVEMKNP